MPSTLALLFLASRLRCLHFEDMQERHSNMWFNGKIASSYMVNMICEPINRYLERARASSLQQIRYTGNLDYNGAGEEVRVEVSL